MSSTERPGCFLYQPGRISYADAFKIQIELHRACASGETPGILILLEHDPVVTMGVKTSRDNLLASEELLTARGIELARTDRGGDITYHGPGQLVGYPIIRLRDHCADVHHYLRTLEQTIIDTLAHFGLAGTRQGPAGVWVGDKKICSIGVAVRKWITYHGFALNVDPDMSHFTLINPCGLRSEQLTSLRELLGQAPPMDEVRAACAAAFACNFAVDLVPWEGRAP
jgi:lipoate-protein ligase B